MARPVKTGLDYFPMDTTCDDNLELFEAECGVHGLGVLMKLWQKIYANGYFIKWDDDTLMLFSKRINVSITDVNAVINACFKRNLLSEKNYRAFNILTSKGIQKRFFMVKRISRCKGVFIYPEIMLINVEKIGIDPESIVLNSEFSTQIKEKESKEKESKEKTTEVDAEIIFPDWLPVDAWNDFLKHRKEIKKPLTPLAQQKAINMLTKFNEQGMDIRQVINNSIVGNWSGLFPINEQKIKNQIKISATGQQTVKAGQAWLNNEQES